MIREGSRVNRLVLLIIATLWLTASDKGLAKSDDGTYALHPGDTIHVNSANLPELSVKATLDVDGYIHLPLVPSLKASNMTVQELLSHLRVALASKVVRQRLGSGQENVVPIDVDEISVEIVEYRPIYVRGDVSKPGELPFRPGITVRQAIALAGGYDVMHFRLENPFLQAADLRAEYQNLWTEFARDEARAKIIQGLLEGRGVLNPTDALQVPVSKDTLKSIVDIELQRISLQQATYSREQAYYERSADVAHSQIAFLTKPSDDAQRNEADDLAYRNKLGLLLDKGVIAHEKVADQQRSLLDATQRHLDYSKRIFDLQREEEDLKQRAAEKSDEQRAGLLKTLQDANVSIATNRAKLQAVGDKLLYTGAMRSQLVTGQGSHPVIEVYGSDRSSGQEGEKVNEDAVLQPGDLIEVSLSADLVGAHEN